jgi:hypothetical protein
LSKNEPKFVKEVIDSLGKSGYQTIKTRDNDKGVDFLATKDQCVFAIQVKERPLESFDIISGSTITAGTIKDSIRDQPAYQNKELVPVLVSGSVVTDSFKTFGSEMGVLVTNYYTIVESLDIACKKLKNE